MTRIFRDLLEAKWAEGKFVCVGLDSDWEQLPSCVRKDTSPECMFKFNASIIDATKDIVCAYKPNIAFYEDRGTRGLVGLETTMEYLREVAGDVPIILDNKRADIGNTNKGYVRFAFNHLNADACTVHPYMGMEAMQPFLDQKDKGIFVLCKTSNPGSGEFQDLPVRITDAMLSEIALGFPVDHDGFVIPREMPLYEWVAWRVSNGRVWNYNKNVGLVVGATYPEQLQLVRNIATVGDTVPILCPGIGKQGGDLQKTVRAARDSRGRGFLINSSSGIIFASKGADFAEAARRETLKLHEGITEELART